MSNYEATDRDSSTCQRPKCKAEVTEAKAKTDWIDLSELLPLRFSQPAMVASTMPFNSTGVKKGKLN